MAPFLDRSAGHVDRQCAQQMLAHKSTHILISFAWPKPIAGNMPSFNCPTRHYMPPYGDSFPFGKNAATRPGMCRVWPRRLRMAPYGENIPWPRMLSQGLGCATCAHQNATCRHSEKAPPGQECGHKTWAAQGVPNKALHAATVCHAETILRHRRPALASGICNLRLFGRNHAGSKWRS